MSFRTFLGTDFVNINITANQLTITPNKAVTHLPGKDFSDKPLLTVVLGFTVDPLVDASMSAFSQEISQTFCVLKSITPKANGVFGTTITTIDAS